jgi:hypothetical protein
MGEVGAFFFFFFGGKCMTTITRQLIADSNRLQHTADLFGIHFPLHLEPFVYAMADTIAPKYRGGFWHFYALSNGGFYMAPASDAYFDVVCENGFEGRLSADALGITVCLYAYSHLSFTGIAGFAETCAQHYHWLREYMLEHPGAGSILRAID